MRVCRFLPRVGVKSSQHVEGLKMSPSTTIPRRCAHGSVVQRPRQERRVHCNVAGPRVEGGDLADRIASGKYGKQGSKLERLTRPARKLLSKDPVGPGNVILPRRLSGAGLAQPFQSTLVSLLRQCDRIYLAGACEHSSPSYTSHITDG